MNLPAEVGPRSELEFAVFRSDSVRCAVPVACVERVLPMMAIAPLPGAPPVVMGLVGVHGQPLPVVDLRRRLQLPEAEYGPSAHLLVVTTARRRLAIASDEVLGLFEIAGSSIASASSVLAEHGAVGGAVSLPDGILLIHDIDAFLSQGEEGQLDEAIRSSQ